MKITVKVLFGLLIVILFFLLRLPNLTRQPIFADEAIYIRWAQVMRAEPTLRFLPITDGKTPLFMWTMMPLLKMIEDPLFAGRFLSVLSGLGTLLGIFLLGKKFFNVNVGLWAALIYATVPYTVFFDRMALVDSMLSAFTLWTILFALWLVKSPRLDLAMILGYLLGGGMLVKTPAMVNLLMLPSTLLVFNFKSKLKSDFAKILLLMLVSLGIALCLYNLLRLGPGFQQLSLRNTDYVFSPLELKGRPLDPLIPHLNDIKDWFPTLLTLPIFLLMFIGIAFVIMKKNKAAFVLLFWALIPLVIQSAFLKTFTARYLLFSIPPLILLAAFGLDNILTRVRLRSVLKVTLAILLMLPLALKFDYLLITNPQAAPFPVAERKGYFEEWTAGYGFSEIAQFLLEEKKKGSVVVGTEGYFGTLPDGLYIYLDKSGIPIVGSGATVSAELRDAAKENTVYFVGNKNRLPKHIDNVKLIKEYPKAKPRENRPQDAIMLYQVFPK